MGKQAKHSRPLTQKLTALGDLFPEVAKEIEEEALQEQEHLQRIQRALDIKEQLDNNWEHLNVDIISQLFQELDPEELPFHIAEVEGLKIPYRPLQPRRSLSGEVVEVEPTYLQAFRKAMADRARGAYDLTTAIEESKKALHTSLKAASAIRLPVYQTRIFVSADVPPGCVAVMYRKKHGVDGIVVNESWADDTLAWDSDGDTCSIGFNSRDQAVVLKFPINRRPQILKVVEYNPNMESLRNFEGFPAPKILSPEERKASCLRAHQAIDPGVTISHFNALDILISRGLLSEGKDYEEAYRSQRSTDDRFNFVEKKGMKQARGGTEQVQGLTETLSVVGTGSVLFTNNGWLDVLMDEPAELLKAYYRLEMGIRKSEAIPPKYPAWGVAKYGSGAQTLTLAQARGWVVLTEYEHKIPGLRCISACLMNNNVQVPLTSRKESSQHLWYDAVIPPIIDARNPNDIRWMAPEEVLEEQLDAVKNIVGTENPRPWGTNPNDMYWYPIVGSNIARNLSEVIGRFGIPVHRSGVGEGLPVAQNSVLVLYPSANGRAHMAALVNKWAKNQGVELSMIGGPKGNIKPYCFYPLVEGGGNRTPYYAHETADPKRSVEIMSQISRSHAVDDVVYAVVGPGATETQLFITPEGVEKHMLKTNSLLPIVTDDKTEDTTQVIVRRFTGEDQVLHLLGRKERDIGKIITGDGLKNMAMPIQSVTATLESGETLPVDLIMSQVEIVNKGAQGFFMEHGEPATIQWNGHIVKVLLVRKMRTYRTLTAGDNVPSRWKTMKVRGSQTFTVLSTLRQGKFKTYNVDMSKPIESSIIPQDLAFCKMLYEATMSMVEMATQDPHTFFESE